MISHLEPSEAPGCLFPTWEERHPETPVLMHAWLVLGGLIQLGFPKGEQKCPLCLANASATHLALPWLRLLGWGWQKRPGKGEPCGSQALALRQGWCGHALAHL